MDWLEAGWRLAVIEAVTAAFVAGLRSMIFALAASQVSTACCPFEEEWAYLEFARAGLGSLKQTSLLDLALVP